MVKKQEIRFVDFESAWFQNRTPILVVEAENMDNVLDRSEDEIPTEWVEFCYDPRWSQMKCSAYLKEKWAFGNLEAFAILHGYMVAFIEPKEGASDE